MKVAAFDIGGLRVWRALLSLALFQAAWFACVAAAAAGRPALGIAAVAAAVTLHLAWSDRRNADAALVATAVATGLVWDTITVQAGWIRYASAGPVTGVAPAWILALWALLATTLREPLRWMHARPVVAALFGAIGGPLSYAAAARMGACAFDVPARSLVVLGAGWAAMTPALVAFARRLDAGHVGGRQ